MSCTKINLIPPITCLEQLLPLGDMVLCPRQVSTWGLCQPLLQACPLTPVACKMLCQAD